jgi:hypothetical protein
MRETRTKTRIRLALAVLTPLLATLAHHRLGRRSHVLL